MLTRVIYDYDKIETLLKEYRGIAERIEKGEGAKLDRDRKKFIERLLDNGFRQHWNGELGLGDMIILKGNESIEIIYLIGYTQKFDDKTIQLELSNKKEENDFSL